MTAPDIRPAQLHRPAWSRAGQLQRIARPVSLVHEMTEIHRRVLAAGGPALLFEQPVDADGRVVADAGAGQSVRHARADRAGAWASGPDGLAELGEMLAELREPSRRAASSAMPGSSWPLLQAALAMGPARSCRPPVQQRDLPRRRRRSRRACRSRGAGRASRRRSSPGRWSSPARPTIPSDVNVGVYRMQVLGRDRLHRALAGASRRRPPSPRCGRPARPRHAGRRRDRRRSGHHPRRGHAAAGRDERTRASPACCAAERPRVATGVTVPPAGPGRRRDRARGHRLADRDRPTRVPTATTPATTIRSSRSRSMRLSAITTRARPDLSLHLHRPAAGRAVGDRRGVERAVRAARQAAVPRDRRPLAAAGSLLLPRDGGLDRQALSGPGAAADDGPVVDAAAVHATPSSSSSSTPTSTCATGPMSSGRISTRFDAVARPASSSTNTPIDYLDFASPKPGLGGKLGIDATNKIGAGDRRANGAGCWRWRRRSSRRVDAIWDELGLGPGRSRP